MELRSSRSRSRTPFVQYTKILNEEIVKNTIKEERTENHSYLTRNRSQNSTSSDEGFTSQVEQSQIQERSLRSRSKNFENSSEESDFEVTSINLERNKDSITKNGGVKSALQIYKEAGEYWNKFPKTDYTYSLNSKDRVELAPGVICMPNMSRKSLRRSMEPIVGKNYEYSGSDYSHEDSKTYNTSYDYQRNNLQRRALNFEDDYNGTYNNKSKHVSYFRQIRNKITTFTMRIYTSFLIILTIIYSSIESSMLWLARGYYKLVSRLFLFDTWLMQKSGVATSSSKKYGALIAIIFLPFLLFAGWWLWSGLNQVLHYKFLPSTIVQTSDLEEEFSKIIAATSKNDLPNKDLDLNEIIKLLLSSSELERNIAKHIKSKTSHFNDQRDVVEALQKEILIMRNKINDLDSNLRFEIRRNSAKFEMEMNRCCKRQFIHIETYVKKLFTNLIASSNHNLQLNDIEKYLNNIFVAKTYLETHLNNMTQNLHEDFNVLFENSAARVMTEVTNIINYKLKERIQFNHTPGQNSALSDSQVHRIVKEVLAVYDADKTGLVDYALESSGGQILSTRCTENYHSRTAVVSVLGIPLWYPSNTPRVVITSGVIPGECWAFQNFPGFIVIQLSNFVKINAFSLEHIPESLAPGGHRDSAPKTFTVWGLQSENDHDPWDYGKFEYRLEEPALQFFPVINEGPAFNIIELRIESNHGNLNYTCLYRFRVHGTVSSTPA